MARIRRSTGNTTVSRILWKAAIYIRLSRDDGNDESYSVKNQRQRLLTYFESLSLEEEMKLVGSYAEAADIIRPTRKSL